MIPLGPSMEIFLYSTSPSATLCVAWYKPSFIRTISAPLCHATGSRFDGHSAVPLTAPEISTWKTHMRLTNEMVLMLFMTYVVANRLFILPISCLSPKQSEVRTRIWVLGVPSSRKTVSNDRYNREAEGMQRIRTCYGCLNGYDV